MKKTVSRFYWVAAAYDDPANSAYHVDAIYSAETMDEVQQLGGLNVERNAMTPGQADAEGLDLSAIGKLIDLSAAAAAEEMKARVVDLEEAVTQRDKQLADMQAAVTAAESRVSGAAAMQENAESALAMATERYETAAATSGKEILDLITQRDAATAQGEALAKQIEEVATQLEAVTIERDALKAAADAAKAERDAAQQVASAAKNTAALESGPDAAVPVAPAGQEG